MEVKFWGTRGSIPVAPNAESKKQQLKAVLTKALQCQLTKPEQIDAFLAGLSFAEAGSYGGNTACVEICDDSAEYTLCDFGTGIRVFANEVLALHKAPQTYHVFMSHLHWDHIMGFPFFAPAYIPGNTIRIYGCHRQLEQSFRAQHRNPNFPVDFDQLPAKIEFIVLEAEQKYQINGFTVYAKLQLHEGDSYGYRFEKDGKSLVYSTDSEHKLDDQAYAQGVVSFFHQADLVVFDAMYSLIETATHKEDWGHSNNLTGVELCHRARVKQLCLFHHDPLHNDNELDASLQQTIEFEALTRQETATPLVVTAAYDGLAIVL